MEHVLSQLYKELNKQDVKDKIESDLVDPVVKYIGNKLYPYIISLTILLSLILLFLLYISLIVKKTK